MSENGTIAESPPNRMAPMQVQRGGLVLSTFDDMWRMANAVVKSGWATKGMEKAETALIAIQFGFELGLPPMMALQSLAVINGRPGVFGDAVLGLVRGSGLLEDYQEWWEVSGKRVTDSDGEPREPHEKELQDDTCTCAVRSKRRGVATHKTSRFSVADAKRANLWGKAGPWSQYPKRMLHFRASGFNLRDNFGDVLRGLRLIEELQDYPDAIPVNAKPVEPPDGRQNLRSKPTAKANGTHAPEPVKQEEVPAPEPEPEKEQPTPEVTSVPDESELIWDELAGDLRRDIRSAKSTQELDAFAPRVEQLRKLNETAAIDIDARIAGQRQKLKKA